MRNTLIMIATRKTVCLFSHRGPLAGIKTSSYQRLLAAARASLIRLSGSGSPRPAVRAHTRAGREHRRAFSPPISGAQRRHRTQRYVSDSTSGAVRRLPSSGPVRGWSAPPPPSASVSTDRGENPYASLPSCRLMTRRRSLTFEKVYEYLK